MKTTLRITVLVSTLGMFSGWVTAQETGAASGSAQTVSATTVSATAVSGTETAAKVDNGALPGDSHVRIVRLSEVRGTIGLDRQTGSGFEQTMQNMPIVEGERLQTGDGYAEVEFEDNSTMRLAPDSRVDFPLLAMRSSGAKASTMNVVMGTVYVNTENTKGNEFLLVAGKTNMVVTPSTHLRLEFDGKKTVLTVFNGGVEVQHGETTQVVDKKQTLTLDAGEMSVAKKVAQEPYDAWDKESIDYHDRYAMANTYAGSGNAYGLSDLNYYGNFINAGGYSFWQPYFVGAGWSPYGNGLWALYPGAGYSFVSPYPWGWLPFHSGNWSFFPGYGYGWVPGGTFYGLNNMGANTALNGVASSGGPTKGVVQSPVRPAPPTVAASGVKPSLVLANQTPMVISKEVKPGSFVFQKDSAGLGVPRGSLGDLRSVSNNVVKHGSASMQVYSSAAGGGMQAAGREVNRGPATLRPSEASTGAETNSANGAWRQGSSGGTSASQASPSFHGGSAASMSAPSAGTSGGSSGHAGSSPK
jgi:FecR protein